MNNKLHFKMYKSGKNWLIAGILSSVVVLGIMSNEHVVRADTSQNPLTTGNAQNNTNAQDPDSQQNLQANNTNNQGTTSDPTNNNSKLNDGQNNQSTSNSTDLASAAASDPNVASNLKLVNGNYVYVNSDGSVAKSTLINSNGQSYYFDKNGHLTDLSKVVPTIGTNRSSNDKNNAIYANKSDYITNTNGFITANSWYRPKKILQNGQKWVTSKAKDFRPLLSVWWPNKTVQLNYANYMNQKGLLNNSLNANSSQAALDAAVKEIRRNIERKIYANHGNITWLKKDLNKFIQSQPEWNVSSEGYHLNKNGGDIIDGLQGGTLIYKNNKLTPYSNSKYRLLNRNPSRQTGQDTKYPYKYSGYEMLLANDVDNSNPVVQAEDLNWLHYLMHFGSITQNDPSANFDSVRIDAVDNMDADLLNIASQYFNVAYKTNRSEKNANEHLSILEDWSKNDPHYLKDHNSNQITIDARFKNTVLQSLLTDPKQRTSLSTMINGLVDRKTDFTENTATPNYSMVRAHDSVVQETIAKIITDQVNPKSNGYVVNNNEINQAFKIYNNDQQQTNKKYTQYNLPSAYALMLTNKDTVPRVYYGDMFTDNGQFMAHKNIYYNSINAMLNARIKYVAGGQSMKIVNVNGDASMPEGSNREILTSVRYGKGALTPNAVGNSITRKSGIAVVESNNPNLKLSNQDKVVINMGAAHKNQAYRPLIDSSSNGLLNYANDNATNKLLHTDRNGNLTLTATDIAGYSNPQESGYLSMWVPVGAANDQDIRTAPKNKKNKNGRIINSNAALDSNVIFEGFSNFQAQPTKLSQYENVVIPKKTDVFKNWGITYMQLPPQYRSVNDNTFLDSTVRDGYSFNDRYDLGFNKSTKYGTANQLANTIKALHRTGIKAMADFVPDQLYSMPKKQVVTASKATIYGQVIPGSNINNTLYAANTVGSGKDYQAKYGGKFLSTLKQHYPSLFKTKQISTGHPIDPSTKIKTWTAKYFNGTNLQGKGAYYVLSNIGNTGYFMVQNKNNQGITKTYLPKQLSGQNFNYGLYKSGDQIKATTTSGYHAQNGFYQDPNGQWYYFDKNGNILTQPATIDSAEYYFLPNGINLRNFIQKNSDGKMYYYSKTGSKISIPGYYSVDGTNYFYVQKDGSLLTGPQEINGTRVYFYPDGHQAKGQIINDDGLNYYYDSTFGRLVIDQNLTINGVQYHAGSDGSLSPLDKLDNGRS